MIYPKDVQEYILETKIIQKISNGSVFPNDINKTAGHVSQRNYLLDVWLCTVGYKKSQAVRNYLDYIAEMKMRFEWIRQNLHYRNQNATHLAGHDVWVSGCAGITMMPLAIYLYYLHSFGITASVLECGVFKGGSTCCLSWACDYLNLKLIAADTFDGLPDSSQYYKKGDFKGSLDEVKENLEQYGKIATVHFMKGLFEDTLKNLTDDLMLIFLDVDLRDSVISALTYAYPRLVEGGVIFSDGLGANRDFEGDVLKPGSDEAIGIIDYFQEHGISHKARNIGYDSYFGVIVPGCTSTEELLYVPNRQRIVTTLSDRNWMQKVCRVPGYVLQQIFGKTNV